MKNLNQATSGHMKIPGSLLVIDDRKIKMEIFSGVQKIIKKIRDLEKDELRFHEKDQVLYNDWYNLTFRSEIQRLEEKRQQYFKLAHFHNDVLACSDMERISRAKAYLKIKKEEEDYALGNEKLKAKIEEKRGKRKDFIEKQIQQEDDFDPFDLFGFDSEDEDEDRERSDSFSPEEIRDFLESFWEGPHISALNPWRLELYEFVKAMPIKEMRQKLNSSQGLDLFFDAVKMGIEAADRFFLLKLWQAAPKAFHSQIQEEMSLPGDMSFDFFMNSLMDEEVSGDHVKSTGENSKFRSESFAQDLKQGLYEKSKNQDQELDRQVKQIFRVLAQIFHPDRRAQIAKNVKLEESWFQKNWIQLQEAYRNKDIEELNRIEVLARLSMQDFSSLTLDDLQEGVGLFEEELKDMKRSLRSFQKNPAWRFSKKKSYAALIKKIRGDFDKQLKPLLEDIRDLERTHRYWEAQSSKK